MTTMNQLRGRFLGSRYRIDALLGNGSSASVYLAHDARLGRDVAVKLLHPGLANDDTFVRRLSSEARAVALLNHPNIVHVYDWGEESDGPFLVMEYLSGGSLRDLLGAGGPITVAQAAAIGSSAARALAFAHRQGIIHRDIKPANLLFDEHGMVHVADFGIAKTLASAQWTEPRGVVLGTARYASPEQALGHSLEGASDVYSLAIVLYEAVTGEAPFIGETPYATLMNRVGRSLAPSLSAGELMPILEGATKQATTERSAAAEFAIALERLGASFPADEEFSPVRVGPVAALTGDVAGDVATVVGIPDGSSATRQFGSLAGAVDEIETTQSASILATSPARHRRAKERRVDRPRARARLVRYFVAVSVLLLVAAAGAYAIPRYLIFDHLVPRLVGMQLSAARRAVASNGLRLAVSSRQFSSTAPAGQVMAQQPQSGRREGANALLAVVVSRGPHRVSLPAVTGRSKSAAVAALTGLHLAPTVQTSYSETVPAGRVISIAPSHGAVPYGSKVSVLSSLGPHPRTIPPLTGGSYGAASAQLSALRLTPVEHLVYSDTVAQGTVISTRPSGGTSGVAVGSQVTVVVSKGPHMVTVPPVSGSTISQAISTLQQAGLTVNEQIGPPFATTATTTDPAPGTSVKIGTPVTLYAA